MDAILEPLVASPALPDHLRTLGDLLAREQARRERFYKEMDESRKVEFINGEVIAHSPAKARHVDATIRLLVLLDAYVSRYDLGWVGSEEGLVCLTRNDYGPDILFYGKAKAASLQLDQMKLPTPDFIVEVLSSSTAGRDRRIKLQDYAAHGVRECWIIDSALKTVEQHVLPAEERSYQQAGTCGSGQELSSVAVPGFRLPVQALFDRAENFCALKALVA